MTTTLRQILLLTAKDLRIEARSRQTLGLVVVLGVLIVTVLGLGLGGRTAGFSATAPLWVAFLFSGVLCFEKTMGVERQDGALGGLLLAPLHRVAIFASKLLSNLILTLAVAAVITPVGVLLFNLDLSGQFVAFFTIISLSMVGFASVGTLFSALVSSTRLQGGLLAMLVFPLTLPLVIASTQIMRRLSEDAAPITGSAFAVLIAFDVVFLVVSWIAFEWVIEP